MRRALRFRAWVETRAFNGEPMGFEYLDLYADNENDFAKFPPKNIEQYTGLKDKNGKEIYEGDVLKIWIGGDKQNSLYVVKDIRELYHEFNRDDGYYVFTKVEVIGNIHENPELLEGEE